MDENSKNVMGNEASRNAYVGSPIKRLEDSRLLLGRGNFVDDIARENLLHAVMLRSPIAHGFIKSVDITEARKMPGIHSVITASDLGDNIPLVPLRLMPMEELEPLGQPVIAEKKVRYVGEVVAVVLADNPARAEDALSAIKVDIEPLEAVSNCSDAISGRSLLFENWINNKAITYRATKGDASLAFETADYVRREHFSTQRQLALPMEPRGILAEWDESNEHLTVEGAAKVPFANRKILGKMMGLLT